MLSDVLVSILIFLFLFWISSMGIRCFLRSLRNDDKKVNYTTQWFAIINWFGGFRLIIAMYFSLIGMYDCLISFNMNVIPMYVKWHLKNSIYKIGCSIQINQCFKKICQVCKVMVYYSENHSILHDNFVFGICDWTDVMLLVINWDPLLASDRNMQVNHKMVLFPNISANLVQGQACDMHLLNQLHSCSLNVCGLWLAPNKWKSIYLEEWSLKTHRSVHILYKCCCFYFTKNTGELYPVNVYLYYT